MGTDRAEFAAEMAATPDEIFATVIDFESYPEWQSAVKRVRVHERDEEGRPTVVETVSNLKVREVRYVLRYHYDEAPERIRWDYVEGDARSVSGEYVLADAGDGRTRVTYRLEVDAGVPVPGLLRRRLTGQVMKGSVQDLKSRVEDG